MCSSRRWSCRQDLPSHFIHDQQISLRVCAYCKYIMIEMISLRCLSSSDSKDLPTFFVLVYSVLNKILNPLKIIAWLPGFQFDSPLKSPHGHFTRHNHLSHNLIPPWKTPTRTIPDPQICPWPSSEWVVQVGAAHCKFLAERENCPRIHQIGLSRNLSLIHSCCLQTWIWLKDSPKWL